VCFHRRDVKCIRRLTLQLVVISPRAIGEGELGNCVREIGAMIETRACVPTSTRRRGNVTLPLADSSESHITCSGSSTTQSAGTRTATPSATNAVFSAANAFRSVCATVPRRDWTNAGSTAIAWLSVETSTSAGISANDDSSVENLPLMNTRRLHAGSMTSAFRSVIAGIVFAGPATPNDDSAIGATVV
jgi:hypothetical protein